jgi:hypothetical protein
LPYERGPDAGYRIGEDRSGGIVGISGADDRLGSFTSFCDVRVMSVHPPIAAAKRTWRHFSFVPGADGYGSLDHKFGLMIAHPPTKRFNTNSRGRKPENRR